MKSSTHQAIAALPNLGPASAKMLRLAGIENEDQLSELGNLLAFEKVRGAGHKPSLNLLYAIDGALTDVKWGKLPLNRRMELDIKVNLKRYLAKSS